MENALGEHVPLIVAMLAGGMTSSLGSTFLLRSARGRATLLRTRGWALALFAFVSIAVGVGAAYWVIRPILDSGGTSLALGSPARIFILGLLIGLPLSLPGIVLAWHGAHAEENRRSKRRTTVFTKGDRREFAADLSRQIQEASVRPRAVEVSIEEDGGRVLNLEGDIDSEEGERLTAALRHDLKEIGFKRVKGGKGSKTWWTKV